MELSELQKIPDRNFSIVNGGSLNSVKPIDVKDEVVR